jgi:multiple sugar transport system ATP-binding protein
MRRSMLLPDSNQNLLCLSQLTSLSASSVVVRIFRGSAKRVDQGVKMAQVQVRKVRKAFGPVEVIHGVDIDIGDGEFVVLVGPSGCGKSTLLRMIAGLEGISAGAISIGARVVNNLPPSQRDIAMVFQNYALYPHMKVRNNMAFALRLRKMEPAAVAERVNQAAEILGLGPFLDRYPRQLSGGQRQRVAMGRAIVRNPQVFLFDEPLSNLDAKLRVQMRTEIKELHQRLRTTTVYVTHDQVEAMTMADKIVVMQDGRVEQIGAPLELFDQPANTFVASFIGSPSMNLLKGAATGGDGPAVVVNGARLAVAGSHRVEDGQPLLFGIRPEHLELSPDGFPAKVSVVEPTGSETMVFLRFGESEIVALFRERHDFKPGDTIHLRPRPDHVHLFHAETGQRV